MTARVAFEKGIEELSSRFGKIKEDFEAVL